MVAARQHPSCDRAQSGQLRRSHEVQSIIDLESQVLQNLRELRRGEPVHCREIRVVSKIAAMLHDPSQNAITQPRRDPRIEGEVIYLALKRVVAVGGVQKENSPRCKRAHGFPDNGTPIGHVFQQAIERDHVKFSNIVRKFCCVGDDPAENGVICEILALSGAGNEFGVKVDSGDFGAETDPVYAPRAGAAANIQDAKRRALRDRKSTRLNSSHRCISYAVFCLKKKKKKKQTITKSAK